MRVGVGDGLALSSAEAEEGEEEESGEEEGGREEGSPEKRGKVEENEKEESEKSRKQRMGGGNGKGRRRHASLVSRIRYHWLFWFINQFHQCEWECGHQFLPSLTIYCHITNIYIYIFQNMTS